ncbi:hypothetical protein FHW69_001344 [Luteibacter sp. Sphag1AF]|uniref:hypothetical protein n=1 Tax=Luteibacter sp. Sphag1AF TaxID=2587031 RepID=UPI001622BCF6|nr:hypothetical protein [Luteibacter sp. Sphag1AF]MBB3226754.1 hypothetical protein [Luteibacter sp. Sphag1AF]
MNHSDDSIEMLLRRQFEGHVADDGFTERVMESIPARRRRAAWPIWTGVTLGIAACGWCIADLPHTPWRNALDGAMSTGTMAALFAAAGISLLACCWALAEADDR